MLQALFSQADKLGVWVVQDKGLVMLDDKPMVEIIIDVLKPQTAKLLINANRNHDSLFAIRS